MKKITIKHALTTLLIIVAWMATINVKAQSTCATAVSFTPSDTFKETTYNITDSIYWLKFIADSNIILNIVPPNETPQASILHIYLYGGACGSLTLLASSGVNDSLLVARGSLTIGSTYYVKVNRTATTSAYFGLGSQYILSPVYLSCPRAMCSNNLITNGLFEIDQFPLNNTCPFYPSWYWNSTTHKYDTINQVCGWMRAWGTPQIKPTIYSPPNYAYLWGQYSTVYNANDGEAIMQTINIPAGTYTLNFSYLIPSTVATMDSLIVCLTNSDFHEHTYMTTSGGDPLPYSYWPSTKRNVIYSAANIPASGTWQHISYQFSTLSTYRRIVIYPSQAHNIYTALELDSVSIVPQQQPAPIIAGQWDLCHGTLPNFITSDTIKNWTSGCHYFWYIGKNGTQHQITTNPFTVNWTGHTNGGLLYVLVSNDSTFACAVDSFKVFACCYNGVQGFADITLSNDTTIYGTRNINGQVIVNANLTLGGIGTMQHAYLLMGPNAKIIIKPGKTITVKDSSALYASCDTMWDGIYLTDNTSKLIVRGNSSIRDAKNAIVSNNGGVFQLSNSDTLRNNYKNVVVNAYSGTHTGKISQTTITCDSTRNLLPQYPPVTATRTYEGVEINSVNAIYIGDTTAYSNRNTFRYMDYGIHAGCSQIYVYNNKFLNINAPAGVSNIGMAVYAFGARNCGDVATIGGQNASGFYRSNYFNNCFNGIYYTSSVGNYIKAEYDTLVMQTTASTFPTGIYAYAAGASNGTIRYNKITNGNYGIDCVNFGGSSTVKINSNYIQNAPWGIYSACVNATTPNSFQIAGNYISFPNTYTTTQTGIQVTNVQGSSNVRLSLLQNRVKFNNPNYNYTAYGIRVQNSTLDSIEQCSVTNTAAAPNDSTSAKNFNGIQVELSPNSYLCEDTTVNIGCGLRFYGSMPSSTIEVNYMDSAYFGVRLDGANVGDQGYGRTILTSYGNQWVGTKKWRIQGTWTAVKWYAYSTPNKLELVPNLTYVKLSPAVPTGYIIDANLHLTSCTVGSMQMILSNTVQDIVNSSYNYTANIAENKYTDNTTAYNILKNEPDILSSMADTNIKYQRFYNNVATSNIGYFEKANSLILAGDYSDAQLLNSGISPTCTMEVNRKTVNDIFLNSWATGRFDLTNNEYNTLYGIAAQQPILGGSGVYSARVMVGEPTANMASARTVGGNNNNNITNKPNIAGLVYPNPVTGEANIDYAIKSGNNVILTIFGLAGNKLAEYALNKDETHFSFSTKEFKPGIYFYQLQVDGSAIEQNKFIIIK